ncbi:FepA family TonB-dependent siderophore receptor [Palleronia sp.]|uniref:FepA family TonB-dependent siderophore receptor n=1 Tax=Palleronia sp. TaxID=1940284 RepID=UPI0035C7D1B6
MSPSRARLVSGTALVLTSFANFAPAFAQVADVAADSELVEPTSETGLYELGTIVLTAEEQIKQALGVSTITEEDIEERPVVNDLAEIIRKMPGVNLTGTSPSGQRGNQRQIDIRGMGPENVLILVDGRPVLSRTSVKIGRSGERDSRGDTNWVPPEMVERIEVIRGPAAARYGSGAAGGVVNIITKQPDADLLQLGAGFDMPESDLEGMTQRYNVLWNKRLSEDVALRFTGNYNRTGADDPDINAEAATCAENRAGEVVCSYDAGSEGVVNRDASVLLSWESDTANTFGLELGYSQQENIFAGDTQLGGGLSEDGETLIEQLAEDGDTTNEVNRGTLALTHTGTYGWGDTHSYLQYEHTLNRRLGEGAAGGGEGAIATATEWDEAILDAVTGRSETYIDHNAFGRPAALTLGAELRWEQLDITEYNSFSSIEALDGSIDTSTADGVTDQTTFGLYVEENIEATDRLTLTPSARVDFADTFGTNLSGGVNAAYEITPNWTVKGGVARAFKAPSLYQLSDKYVYVTRGRGCPYPYYVDGPCYVLGNSDLDPETSINSEIGVAYNNDRGVNATLTYFHNDYHDKIQSGTEQVGRVAVPGFRGVSNARLFQWMNVPDSQVEGLEGNFAAPVGERARLSVNATYMINSRQTLEIEGGTTSSGEIFPDRVIEVPLSLVPEYTINGSFEFEATDHLKIIPSLTHYGKIEAAEYNATMGIPAGEDDLEDRDPYTLVNLGVNYAFDNGTNLKAGITNLLDKRILRSGEGANTYNEPGRAFYFGLTRTF